MKNYVVAMISFLENEIKQFKIEAENKYYAVVKALYLFHENEDENIKQSIDEWIKSDEFPKTIEDLESEFPNFEMDYSLIEI